MTIADLNTGKMTALLAAAPVYRKNATVTIRSARAGERIVTTLANGHEETAVTCEGGEPVITNPGGEQYVPIGGWTQVHRRYEPLGQPGRYRARGLIRAIVNPAGRDVTILAPWGEEQHGAADCLFAAEFFPDDPERIGTDRYLIGAAEFEETYALVIQSAANEKTVLVGDTYETPEDAAEYAVNEAEALRMLRIHDEIEMGVIERERETEQDGIEERQREPWSLRQGGQEKEPE